VLHFCLYCHVVIHSSEDVDEECGKGCEESPSLTSKYLQRRLDFSHAGQHARMHLSQNRRTLEATVDFC
jgi:hypothetical protein